MNARINESSVEVVIPAAKYSPGQSEFVSNRHSIQGLHNDNSAVPLQSYGDFHLTNREKQVLGLIACGYTNKYAARELKISPYTVADYVKEIYRKLHIGNRAEATIVAIKLGLLDTSLLVRKDPDMV